MITYLIPGLAAGTVPTLALISVDGMLVYGLMAFVVGLIAWSKYTEPPLSDPRAAAPAKARGAVAAAERPVADVAAAERPVVDPVR